VCGEQDTNEHIFLCERNQLVTLTPEVYQQLVQKGGPSTEKMKLKQIACDIQQVIKDRKQLQETGMSATLLPLSYAHEILFPTFTVCAKAVH